MRLVAALLLGACFLSACAALSNHLFPGPMPAPTAPRLVLPAARVAEILEGRDFYDAGGAPYWDPTQDQFSNCEASLWRRAHWSLFHDDLGAYVIQVFGVTNRGRPVVVMLGVCRAESELALRSHPRYMIGSFHSRCLLYAVCDPESQEVVQYYKR